MQTNEQMISFRRTGLEDLSLIHHWITRDPEVNRYWGYAHQGSFEEIVSVFQGYVTGDEPTDPYLILYGDLPIGYIQTFKWSDYPDYRQYVDLTDAASLDLFIGERQYRNKGLGPAILSRFLREYVFADPNAASCVINPETSNQSAIRVYEKVGFRMIRTVQDIPGEPGPVCFMRIDREQLDGR